MPRRKGMPESEGKRPIVFGEVLFDTFPDGSAVLGGAPFNVAWHLQGFGLTPVFISRVGDDARGRQVLAAMARVPRAPGPPRHRRDSAYLRDAGTGLAGPELQSLRR